MTTAVAMTARASGAATRARSGAATSAALLVGAFACGPEEPGSAPSVRAPLQVHAFPAGKRFEGELVVRLHADGPSVIRYTVDGSSPSASAAPRYETPLVLTEGALVSFVAVGDDGRWSAPGSELYEHMIPVAPFRPPDRGLELSDDLLFFSAEVGERALEETVEIRSVGLAPVDISAIYIAPDGGFFEAGVFETSGPPAARLAPGERLTLRVRYHVTETLRTAALVLETNGLRAPEGRWIITLGGRVSAL